MKIKFLIGCCLIAVTLDKNAYAQNQITNTCVNGLCPVTAFGAKCDGNTDDTVAFQAAIKAANTQAFALQVPHTGTPCVVSQLDETNQDNRIRIVGDSGPISFQSVITCNESSPNTGVCLDLTGSQYVEISHIRFQYGGYPPQAVIRMGKSTGGNGYDGNSQVIVTSGLDVEAGGSYGVYNNGGEIWSSYNDTFEGASKAQVVLSSGNFGHVNSPFAGLPTMPVSMTKVDFYSPIIIGGGTSRGIYLDTGTGGSVDDVQILGGYGQVVSGAPALFSDVGSGPIRGFKVSGFRLEPQGTSNIAGLIDFINEVDRLEVNAMYSALAQPSQSPITLNVVWASNINLQPGDNQQAYPANVVSCHGASSTLIVDYNKYGGGNTGNSCPGSVEMTLGGLKPVANTIENLIYAGAGEGTHAVATDCTLACSRGIACSSGGSHHCEVYFNGSTWVETGN